VDQHHADAANGNRIEKAASIFRDAAQDQTRIDAARSISAGWSAHQYRPAALLFREGLPRATKQNWQRKVTP